MEKNLEVLRHGDVLLISGSKMPSEREKLNHLTLALGEATGHSHKIIEGDAVLYETEVDTIETVNGKLDINSLIPVKFLEVKSDQAILTHEEHKQITLTKGVYGVIIQREYEPEGWRHVID